MEEKRAEILRARRKKAMEKAGVTNKMLQERWAEKFGHCVKSTVSDILSGRWRSIAKEQDFAEVVGVPWEKLWDRPQFVRRRDLLPSPEELGPMPRKSGKRP